MKKLFSIWLVGACVVTAIAATDTIEQPIVSYSTPIAVSVSVSAYTNVTAASTRISGMTAILIDNPSTNSAAVHGHVGNCTSTAVSITDVKGPIEIAPSSNGGYIALAEDACLWLVSRHTAAESITIQGVSQKR